MSESYIEAKVARLISDDELAVNAGAEKGVARGDIITVLKDFEVKDPDTGEPLGSVRRAAIRLEVVEVQPAFAIGRTYEIQEPLSMFTSPRGSRRRRLTTNPANEDKYTTAVRPGQLVHIRSPRQTLTS